MILPLLHSAGSKTGSIADLPLAGAFSVSCASPLAIAVSSNGLRGIMSSEAVSRGGSLLTVPLRSCLVVPRGPDDDAALAASLLRAVATDDNWMAYSRDFLPRATDAAMTWEEEEIEELQVPSAVEAAQALAERCTDTFEAENADSVDTDDGDGEGDGGDDEGPSFETWRWALSMVYSRSFSLEALADGSEGPYRALAPFVDLFNHLPESPSEYASRFDEWEADGFDEPPSPWRLVRPPSGDAASDGAPQVALCADRAVPAGGEVCLPYGIETSAECLITSGFVPDGNTADYATLFADPVELLGLAQQTFNLSDAQAQQRLARLAELDAVDAPLAARPGGLAASAHVLACARLAAAADEEVADRAFFEEDYVEAIGHFTLVPGSTISAERLVELDAAAAGFCADIAEAALAELPTSMAEDEALLADAIAGCDAKEEVERSASERLALALRYRLGFKQLLNDFAAVCRQAGV